MENQNNTKETEKPVTAPTSPSPAVAVESPPSSPPPPSLSSSPSHEFSFTISFHAPNSLSGTTSAAAAAAAVKLSKSSSSPVDFDLAPADDIFFHGHLLPLHFVSHRPSDVSIYNTGFLPLSHIESDESSNTAAAATAAAAVSATDYDDSRSPKSFSFFWFRKWLRGNDGEDDRDDEKQRRKRRNKKVVFGFVRLWKKYTSLTEPFLFFKDWKEKRDIRRNQFSFSGDGRRRRWWEGLSAPASIRTSPANSGLLVAPSTTNFSSEESTLEELQNAIQAAIAHCKNSIAVEDDKC